MRHAAVIGGGILGVVSALLLVRRGWCVSLFERDADLLLRTSGQGEGKIHLGPVYALGDRATVGLMQRGAVSFGPIVARAVGDEIDWPAMASDRFAYIVMPTGLCDEAGLAAAYRAVNRAFAALPRRLVLGEEVATVIDECPAIDGQTGLPSFASRERALDPQALRRVLIDAVGTCGGITVRLGAEVDGISPDGSLRCNGDTHRFDAILNCAWERRGPLLMSAGLPGTHDNHRVKLGVFGRYRPGIRSVTLVHGAFGDVVGHRDRTYLSWYPVARLAFDEEVPDGDVVADLRRDPDRLRQLATRQVAAMARLGLVPADLEIEAVGVGVILATGTGDIDRPDSDLHRRGDFGLRVDGRIATPMNYKFTTAPLAAHEAVERITHGR
ncbi:MAG: hypothetical protein RL190_1249 [Actinomycetota bacterium]|jgi:hypothetical protein